MACIEPQHNTGANTTDTFATEGRLKVGVMEKKKKKLLKDKISKYRK